MGREGAEVRAGVHVLLVGIDAYERVDPLFGCVHDVDALEAVFLDRLKVPAGSITKLVAAHASRGERRPRLPEERPTSERLRAALEALAGEGVRPGDRVFIHYSGHGTLVLPRGKRVAREALVPVDAPGEGELLFDYEINDILRRIAARAGDLTVVLDCCSSAGVTRSALRPEESAVRFCEIKLFDVEAPAARGGEEARAGILSSFDPSDPGFLVVAAAQSSEPASEGRDARGVRHGAFTAALLDRLALESEERLTSLRWADLWPSLTARVTGAFPGQHPCLLGRSERRVFGGPFLPQDPGYALREVEGRIRVLAGSLAGLGPGALVAVYGPSPAFFPPLHSPEDRAARLGVLCVESATTTYATTTFVGGVFPIVEGARGRLVKAGKGDSLVVGLDPFDPELARWLEAEALCSVARPSAGSARADVFVGVAPDGRYWVGDEIHGLDAGDARAEAPLAYVARRDLEGLTRALLHYARYCLPLRLARRSRDFPGALRLRVLDARNAKSLAPEELSDPPLPEVEADPQYRYRIVDGQPICFSVENRAPVPLYTHLINCCASGRVEILGPTQLEIAPGRRQAFWLRGHLGRAFPCRVATGRESSVERLVLVGTTSPEVDLRVLAQRESFEEAICVARREMLLDEEPEETWAAILTTVKIVRGS